MLHFSQPPIFATSSGYFVFFSFSSLIFMQLFGGLSKFRFPQNLYTQKALNFQFPMVLTLLDLELRSSRYCTRKEDDTVLKNSVTFFLKNFVPSNPEYTSSSPFYEMQPRPCFFKMVLLDCFSSCPIGIVYCTKSAQKLPVFPSKKKVKILLGFFSRYFGNILAILTSILAHKISFQREKYPQ